MDINKRTSELLINKMLNAQNPNSKSSDFASKMDQRGVEPLSENIAIQLSPSADVILCFALRLPDDGPSHCYPKEFPLKPIGISLKVSHY